MAGKIKVIIKRPDERYGHVTHISNTLENFQRTVGGPIETLVIAQDTLLIVNEEGKLREGFIPNFKIWSDIPALGFPVYDVIYGTAVVVGADGEEFTDVPISFDFWQELLLDWGNY